MFGRAKSRYWDNLSFREPAMLLAIDTGNTNTLFAVHDGTGLARAMAQRHRHDQDGRRLRRVALHNSWACRV